MGAAWRKDQSEAILNDTGRHGRGLSKGSGKGEKGTDLRES